MIFHAARAGIMAGLGLMRGDDEQMAAGNGRHLAINRQRSVTAQVVKKLRGIRMIKTARHITRIAMKLTGPFNPKIERERFPVAIANAPIFITLRSNTLIGAAGYRPLR